MGRSGYRHIREEIRSHKPDCAIRGLPIRYDTVWPHDDSFTVDHIKPWSIYPNLRYDRGNLRPAHLKCNNEKGDRDE